MTRQSRWVAAALLCAAVPSSNKVFAQERCDTIKPGFTPYIVSDARSGEEFCFVVDGGAAIQMAVVVFRPRPRKTVELSLANAIQVDESGRGTIGSAVSSSFRHNGRPVVLAAPGGGYGNPFLFNYYKISMRAGNSGVARHMITYWKEGISTNLGRLSFTGTMVGAGWPAARLQKLGSSGYRRVLQAMLDGMAAAAARNGDAALASSLVSAEMVAAGRFDRDTVALTAAWAASNYAGLQKILHLEDNHPGRRP